MFGMPPALNHQTSRNSEKTCGWATHTYQTLPRESPSSGPSSAPAPLFNTNSAKPTNNTNTYSTAPPTSRISRLPGCCFFFWVALAPGVPISCECARPTSRQRSPTTTTSRSRLVSAASSKSTSSEPPLQSRHNQSIKLACPPAAHLGAGDR